MSVTKELREWIQSLHTPNSTKLKDEGELLADRIDLEYERAVNIVEPMTEEQRRLLDEHGWMRLPKDEDGEYVHVGDVMEWSMTGKPFEVIGIGDGTLFYVRDDISLADWARAATKRHHYEPTVEGVLTEMLEQAVGYSDAHTTAALNAVAEYAKRLALAGGAQ